MMSSVKMVHQGWEGDGLYRGVTASRVQGENEHPAELAFVKMTRTSRKGAELFLLLCH
jgi:hypothetical protein